MDKVMEKIYVAGHRGMVCSAIVRTLEQQGQADLVEQFHYQPAITVEEGIQRFVA
jgi:GDP-L-fucose synthase